MGKSKGWRNKRLKMDKGAGGEKKEKVINERGQRNNYDDIIKENSNFEKYYKLQKIVPEDEWPAFMQSLRDPLPTTFRITATRSQVKAFCHILEENLIRDAVLAGDNDAEYNIKPFKLPWYPENLAWQLNLSRKDIRRNEAYYRLHQFLISETASGNISRQEAVSMIPPLALQIEPHHKCLDMCAAPGSKSAQIVEILQDNDNKESEGLLIANDMDNKRCYMLVHQTKRLLSSAFVITNHNAAQFPDIYHTGEDGTRKRLEFDRVLCDVPCSGDGTIRKNIDVWTKWSPANGLFLHQVQHQILRRGLELLKIGGLLVYSTCSLNPMENEAVIHRVLKEAQGTVSLLDINLPNLKHSPGLEHWTPCSRDLVGYDSVEDVLQKWKNVVRDYVFPPSKEDAPKYQLNKCVRVLSHQQDTGCFFIALLTKTAELPWVNEGTSNTSETSENSTNGSSEQTKPVAKPDFQANFRSKKSKGFKEDPYIFIKEDDPFWPPLKAFYELDDSLKSENFLTRSVVGKKNIYYVTNLVKDIITQNEKDVKFINTGVKTMVRCGQKFQVADYRLAQEGLKAFLPFIRGRRVKISVEDFIILLENDDETKPPLFETLSVVTQAQLRPLGKGSVILDITGKMPGNGPEFSLDLVAWKGSASLRLYVPKGERMHYLRLCGGNFSKYETNKFQEIRDAAEAANADKLSKEEMNADCDNEINDDQNGNEEIKEECDTKDSGDEEAQTTVV